MPPQSPTPPIYVGRPNIGDRARFLERVDDILESGWLSNAGKYCTQFEDALANFLGVRHCIAVCNATVGLEIAARCLGMEGEVIVPSFTFIATANALRWTGLTPVFCDVDPATHNLDPDLASSLVTERTTGIVGVHCWGRPCDVEGIDALAARHGLKVMYDASHALGCTHKGTRIGGFGGAEVFSFHATKFVNTFEGGAITTNDDALAEKIRAARNFGFSGPEETLLAGTNGKLCEVSAAMGLTNLESYGEFRSINESHYRRYREGLEGLPGLTVMNYPDDEENNYQYVVVEVDGEQGPLDRNELWEALESRGIRTRRYFYPGCHQLEPYAGELRDGGAFFPATEALSGRVLVLPTGSRTPETDVDTVIDAIRALLSPAS